MKVNLYIDGFNLYFGLRTFGHRYKWLDVLEVGRQLCRSDQQLGDVYYFTSPIKGADPEKIKRQTVYLEALQTTGAKIVYGKYQKKKRKCKASCGERYTDYEEKETDVNIGTRLLLDAVSGAADVYFLLSGDSDLIYPMEQARDTFGREVIPVFPPNRHSNEMKQRMGRHIPISEAFLRKCQLPATVTKKDGYVLRRPEKWQ